jgi:hypothetical protein
MQTKRSTINATETFPANNVIVQCVNDCTEFVLSSLAQCSDQTCQEFLDPSWSDTEESLTAPRQHRQRRRRQRQRCQQRRVRNKKEDDVETVTTTSIRSQRKQRGLDAPAADRDDKVPLTEYDSEEEDQTRLSKPKSRSLIVNPSRSEPDITNHRGKDHVTEEGGYLERKKVEELSDEDRDDVRSTRLQLTMSRTNNDINSGKGDSGTELLPKIHPTATITTSTGNSPSEEKCPIIRTSFWPTHHPTSLYSNECKRGYTEQTVPYDTPIENAVDMTWRSVEMKPTRFYNDNSNQSIASETWSIPSKPASLHDDTSNQSFVVNKNSNNGNVELNNTTTKLQHCDSNLTWSANKGDYQATFQNDDISIESFFSDTSSSNSNSINIWKRERLKTALQKFLEDTPSSIESTSSTLSMEDRQDSPSVDRYHV